MQSFSQASKLDTATTCAPAKAAELLTSVREAGNNYSITSKPGRRASNVRDARSAGAGEGGEAGALRGQTRGLAPGNGKLSRAAALLQEIEQTPAHNLPTNHEQPLKY